MHSDWANEPVHVFFGLSPPALFTPPYRMSALNAQNIAVSQTIISADGTALSDHSEFKPMRISLDQTIRENADRLGHTGSHTLAIFVQLLTTGKVKFSFRTFTKRLELVDKTQIMDRAAAIIMVEGCLSELRGEGEHHIPELTQNIIIQTPKARP